METWQCGKPNNVGDLEKQPFYRFISKTYILHPVALGALLYALGGFPFLVWGMVRIPGLKLSLLLVHLTWQSTGAYLLLHSWGLYLLSLGHSLIWLVGPCLGLSFWLHQLVVASQFPTTFSLWSLQTIQLVCTSCITLSTCTTIGWNMWSLWWDLGHWRFVPNGPWLGFDLGNQLSLLLYGFQRIRCI